MNDWDQDIYHLNDEQPQPQRGSLLVAKPAKKGLVGQLELNFDQPVQLVTPY